MLFMTDIMELIASKAKTYLSALYFDHFHRLSKFADHTYSHDPKSMKYFTHARNYMQYAHKFLTLPY